MSPSGQDRFTRRTFMLASGALAASATSAAMAESPVNAAVAATATKKAELPPNSVVLFQGDSITDAGRSRGKTGANDWTALGRGYPCLLAGAILAEHPGAKLQVYNRGISGNKVPDLAARWQADAIELKPALLSILVGVNDIWHKLNGRYDGSVEDYKTGYHDLLDQTLQALPDVRIVICEPFVLRCGAIHDGWFPEFDQRRAVAKCLAKERNLCFVPFQSMFDQAAKQAPPQYWAGDGVHPTLAGHALMAKTWREAVGL